MYYVKRKITFVLSFKCHLYFVYLGINKETKCGSSRINELPQMTKSCNSKMIVETESVNLNQNKSITNTTGSPTLIDGVFCVHIYV